MKHWSQDYIFLQSKYLKQIEFKFHFILNKNIFHFTKVNDTNSVNYVTNQTPHWKLKIGTTMWPASCDVTTFIFIFSLFDLCTLLWLIF